MFGGILVAVGEDINDTHKLFPGQLPPFYLIEIDIEIYIRLSRSDRKYITCILLACASSNAVTYRDLCPAAPTTFASACVTIFLAWCRKERRRNQNRETAFLLTTPPVSIANPSIRFLLSQYASLKRKRLSCPCLVCSVSFFAASL